MWKWKTSRWQTCARGSGGSLRFGPKCAALIDDGVSLPGFGSPLEDFAFDLERAGFSCTDNERVDGALCQQRRVLLRDYLLSCLVSLYVEGRIN
jgi:hypothetical protein